MLVGGPRVNCYAALDKKLTTQIVPWVPYLWSYAQSVSSKNVTQVRASTSSAGRSPTPTWRSSDLTRVRRGRPGHPAGAPAPALPTPMLAYILRRLVWAVLVLLAVTLITFFIFYKLPPGDPALRFVGKQPTPENIALVRHNLGLDKPFYVQYGKFLKAHRARRQVRLAGPRLLVRLERPDPGRRSSRRRRGRSR